MVFPSASLTPVAAALSLLPTTKYLHRSWSSDCYTAREAANSASRGDGASGKTATGPHGRGKCGAATTTPTARQHHGVLYMPPPQSALKIHVGAAPLAVRDPAGALVTRPGPRRPLAPWRGPAQPPMMMQTGLLAALMPVRRRPPLPLALRSVWHADLARWAPAGALVAASPAVGRHQRAWPPAARAGARRARPVVVGWRDALWLQPSMTHACNSGGGASPAASPGPSTTATTTSSSGAAPAGAAPATPQLPPRRPPPRRPAAALGWGAGLVLCAAAALFLEQTWEDERAHPEQYHHPHDGGVSSHHEGEPDRFSPTLLTAEALPSAAPDLMGRGRGDARSRAGAAAAAAMAAAAGGGRGERGAALVGRLEAALARLDEDEAAARAELERIARGSGGSSGSGSATQPADAAAQQQQQQQRDRRRAAQLREDLESIAVLKAALAGEVKKERAGLARGGG
jgi:hypothetical protein